MDDVVLQDREWLISERSVNEVLLASDLYRGSRILRVHAEVDVRAEAHPEDVRWHFDSLDDRSTSAIEEHDLKRWQHIGVREQVPR